MARLEAVMRSWMSWGGLVLTVAAGSAIAAFNWYAIAQGFARGDALAGSAEAAISAQRYAFAALLLLVIGLRLMDRRGRKPGRHGEPLR
jgi:hypothetical protein